MNKLIKVIVIGGWWLVIGGWCLTAGAATSEKRTTTDANGITWNYTLSGGVATLGWGSSSKLATDAGGDLVIPSSLDGYPLEVIGGYSFRNQDLKSVVIPSSVTTIAQYAFDYLSAYALDGITNLVIPASVKTVGGYSFSFWSPPNLTVRFESMKAWCEADRQGSSSNPMEDAKRTYFGSEAVQDSGDLVIPDGTERITSYAFYGNNCANVTNIVIPTSVKEIGTYAFANFKNLKTITIPSSVQTLGNAIFGTTSPQTVVLPADFPYFENLLVAFSGATTIIEEGNPNYRLIDDGLYSADGAVFLMAMKPANPLSNYTLKIADTATRIAEKACSAADWITAVIVPAGVKEIPAYAFQACISLQSIELPDSLKTIGNYAFSGCSKLASVRLPNTVQSIGNYAFQSCTSLQSIELSDSLQSIGMRAFYGCSKLASVRLPASMQSLGSSAFMTSTKVILSADYPYVENFMSKFSGLSVDIEDGNPNYARIGDGIYSADGTVFLALVKPTSNPSSYTLTLADTTTRVANRACYGQSWITAVTLPDGLQSIDSQAFYSSGLKEVVIPDSVTQIGSRAFYYCRALTNLVVGSRVLQIEAYAFQSCAALERLLLPAGTTVNSSVFDSTPSALTLVLEDGTTTFDADYLANAAVMKTLTKVLEVPPSCKKLDLVAMSQLVNLTKVVFRGESLTAVGVARVQDLKAGGLDVGYVPEGGTEAEGAEFLAKFVLNESQVAISSSAVREGNAGILDVRYVVTGAPETFAVRSLAFVDGERSFAKVIRPLTFADDTAANANGTVAANEPHDIAWKFSEDWNAKLGRVALEVMTVEVAELPLKFVKIPATASHAALNFSCNALTDAKVLDALFWHYADPDCPLTLTDGRLYDGATLLAEGATPTAAGTAWVFAKMGYGLLTGAELEYANEISRLGLVPEGARQYAVEHPAK